jgi:antitoxin (DNA-binding transcriptional repressor) of toxin-antitoxin stability system
MFAMDSNVKGAVAEQAIVPAATRLGVPVLKPVSEHGRSDLALEIGDRLWRVQCKWGKLSANRDVVIATIRGSRCAPNGYVWTTYTEDEIDLLAVYCEQLNRCFLVPSALIAGMAKIHLRLRPARTGQKSCITLADDFDFEGAVAQLGRAPAWHAGGQGFKSPQLHSSSEERRVIAVGSNSFRDRFGYWIDRVAAGEEVLVTRCGKPRIRLSPANFPQASAPARLLPLTPPIAPRTARTDPR